jgi:predicted nuclease of predicted toxin-antitoxin system
LRCLIDQQLPAVLADYLRKAGHQAVHVGELGLSSASDLEIWREAERQNAVIVTKDEDFPRLSAARTGPAVIWVRLGNCDNATLIRRVVAEWPRIVERLSRDERIVELR